MKTKLTKKIVSIFLSVVLLMSCLPISVWAAPVATNSSSVADPKTLNGWETWFPEGSSRAAGSIFLDKSVYTASEALSDDYFRDIRTSLSFENDNFGNENFLVALSALGSNSEVLGYSHNPTDTILVLDASTSMGTGEEATSSIDDMVYGANEAIKRLISLNNYNRVGVVIYNGTSSVLLPLDRYTSENANEDILRYERTVTGGSGTWRDPYTYENRIYIASNVKNSNNQSVTANYVPQAQGTYTQGGIYTAAEQFLSADTVIEDGKIQGGTKRIPIMVLMTDGEPSYRTQTGSNTTINKYNAATNSNADRSNFREDDVTAFSTMLTAAWAEAEITAHYGMDTRFYTLGYALSANHQYAQNVLDPMNPNNALASRFSSYASQYLRIGQGATVAINNENNRTAFRVTRMSSPDRVTTLDYVDRYWQAAQASQLQSAFDSIVDEIIIQSRYYSTLVPSNNHAQDGFVSFTDEIGSYMEVKDIKGIYIGDGKLVSGGMFAEFATTGVVEDYDNTNYEQSELVGFENEILSAVSERFSISLSEASLLLNTAKDNGFISYTSKNEFSNYIAWYADEDNNYIAPYTKAETLAQNNAKYIVRSYFYMGDVTQNHVETSMLYALVRVRENIETGRQIVDINVPAALLPMVTYTITVDGDTLTSENITGITCQQKKPISLLFEVGLDSEITPINITQKVDESFRKDQNGVYTFYTNRWRDVNGNTFVRPSVVDPHVFNHGIMNTTVTQFIPSLENQRFYYTENMQILDSSYNVYTGSKPNENGSYFIEYKWVEGSANNATLKTAYDPVATEILKNAQNIIQIDGKQGWFINKGTPQFYFGEEVHGEQAHSHKTANLTNTLGFSAYPQMVYHDSEEHHGYHILNYHGNNGFVKATSAQGIKLSKNVSQVVANAPDSFDFEISLTGTQEAQVADSYTVYIEHAVGNPTTYTADVNAGKLNLTLKDGDVAYIYDIDVGVSYTVTEKYNQFYTATVSNSSNVVEAHTFSEVNFINSPKGYGSLLVEKDITHPFDNITTYLADKEFDIKVEFTGDANDLAQIAPPATANKVSDSVYTLKLKDGHDAVFTHIPAGVEYLVTEENITSGFTLVTDENLRKGTVANNIQSEALLVNNYSPSSVSADIEISGEKTILNNDGTTKEWSDEDVYQVALQQITLGGTDSAHIAIGEPVYATLNKNQKSYSLNVNELKAENGTSPLVFDEVGTYNFMVYEVFPSNVADRVPNIKYDATFAIFSVEIIDDASGSLKVGKVSLYPSDQEIQEGQNGYEITKNFTNYYQTSVVNIPLFKRVVDENNAVVNEHSGGIMFGVFEAPESTAPVYDTLTAADGSATIKFPVFKNEYVNAKYYYIREMLPPLESQVVGMTYDTAVKYVVSIVWNAADDAPTVKYYNYDANAVNGLGTEITDITAPLTITNTYENNLHTPAISFGGKKTLNDGALRQGDTFTFELYETDATFNINGLQAKQTKVVNSQTANGEYVFDNITFDSVGTKHLVVREANGGTTVDGIIYDNTVYHITVDVTKTINNNKTILTAKATHIHKVGIGDVEADELNFNNTYVVNGNEEVVIRGNKTLNGRHLVEGEFEFEITAETQGAPMPFETKVQNDIDGNFLFPTIHYDIVNEKGLNKEYVYTIKEEIPNANEDQKGITYNSDPNLNDTYRLVVALKDDGKGGITKTVTLNGTQITDINLSFVNSYAATGTNLTFSGAKYFNKDSGEFSFDLYNANSDFAIDSLIKSGNATVLNGEGKYSITLEYTTADRGYHYYVLKEHLPAETDRVLYDSAEYHITVNVLDNGHGEMEAHVMNIAKAHSLEIVSITELDFTNVFVPKPEDIKVEIGVEKTVVNKGSEKLSPEGFEFLLENAETKEKLRVKTDSKGKANFALGYTEEDVDKIYTYKLTEVNDGKANVSYSTAEYIITVAITLNEDNELVATLTNNGKIATTVVAEFENVYDYTPTPESKPEPEYPESPKTGDNTNIHLWFALLFVSGGGIIGTAIYGRKKEEAE